MKHTNEIKIKVKANEFQDRFYL